MKTFTVFAAVMACVLATASAGLSAEAQNESHQGPTPAAAPAPPPAPPSSAPPAAAAAPAAPSADAKLTEDETAQAVAIITSEDKCFHCHGAEEITDKHFDKAGWQGVLDNMGPSANLSKAETALVLRYLVENYGPLAKP